MIFDNPPFKGGKTESRLAGTEGYEIWCPKTDLPGYQACIVYAICIAARLLEYMKKKKIL